MGLPSSAQRQEWGQGPQDVCADALAGTNPLNFKDLLREGKAREVLGTQAHRRAHRSLGMFPGQSWPGLRHRGLGEGVWSKDNPVVTTTVLRIHSCQFFLGKEKSGGVNGTTELHSS